MELLTTERAQHHFSLLLDELNNTLDNRSLVLGIRQIVEELFNHLTENENVVFANLFAKIEYTAKAFHIDKATLAEIHSLRIFTNDRVHDRNSSLSTPKQVILGQAKTLYKLIKLLNETKASHPALETIFSDKSIVPPVPPKDFKVKEFVRAYVLEIFEDEKKIYPNRKSIVLRLQSDEDNSIFDLVCIDWEPDYSKNNPGNPCVMLAKMAAAIPYTCIGVHGLVEYTDKYFITGIKTTIVLDPDFLLDASDIAKCIDEPEKDSAKYFFIDKLVSWQSSNSSLLLGSVVNSLLENIILGVDTDYEQQFEEIFKSQILKSATVSEFELEEVKAKVKFQHIPLLEEAYDKFFQNKETLLETSFISTQYGIQGRLDALIIPSSPEKPYDILELKSGKPNTFLSYQQRQQGIEFKANHQHEGQVAAYKLLLNSVFGAGKAGNGNLLYTGYVNNSGVPKIAIVNVVLTDQLLQRLIFQRNLAVHGIRQIAQGKLDRLFNDMATGQVRRYVIEKQQHFVSQVLNNQNQVLVDYYKEVLSFTVREFLCAKVGAYRSNHRDEGGAADLWRLGVLEKQSQYRIIEHLINPTYDNKLAQITFQIAELQKHCFRKGDLVLLYGLMDDKPAPFLHQQLYKGRLVEINEHSLIISINNRQPNNKFLKAFMHWAIEPDSLDANYWSIIKGMYSFLSNEEKKHHLILGLQPPSLLPNFEEVSLSNLTPHQQLVLNKALRAKDYFLLQGPPGTGKTSAILVNLVRESLRLGMRCITVLAFTNRAMEEIKAKLRANNIEFLSYSGEDEHDPSRVSAIAAKNSIANFREAIKGFRVVVSTVSTYQSRLEYTNLLLPYRDMVIVDEASQLLESQLAGLLVLFQKFVLIGDQIQLPAVVQQASGYHQVKSEALLEAGFYNLSASLFERLYNTAARNGWNDFYDTLIDHFRMHEGIAFYLNKNYQYKLSAFTERQKAAFSFYNDCALSELSPKELQLISQLKLSRVQIFDSEPVLSAKYHLQEAKWTALLVFFILKLREPLGLKEDVVGVISPWRAQNVKIIEEFERLLLENDKPNWRSLVKIDTVERFQGLECEIIVASMALDSSLRLKGACSLTTDGLVDRKFNVALSRAREQFILLGNISILRKNEHYRSFLNAVEERGAVLRLEVVHSLLG